MIRETRPTTPAALLVMVSLFVATPVLAQESSMNAGELAHALDRLSRTGRVLYVAAHPDDENTRLLAHLANARHFTVAYLSMTRGGGGQNLIGSEQGALLDVIRTEELLAARRIDGAQQRFTRMRDFGFSKSPGETLRMWDHDEALSDVVWVIRTFQPDVIITRFDEEPPNHGHHTASAILAREAFAAAADPQRFPEQLRDGVTPWKATRLLHNLSTWREVKIPKDAIALDVGTYDARLGLSHGELAALSRSQHKSQGFGASGQRGKLTEHFVLLAGSRPKTDLLDGIELDWTRFGPKAAPFERALNQAGKKLDRDAPEHALPALLTAHRTLASLPDSPRVRDARALLERVIASAAGLFVRATAERPTVVPGAGVKVDVELVARRPVKVRVGRVELPGLDPVAVNEQLEPNEKKLVSATIPVPRDARISMPYWLEQTPLEGRYELVDRRLVGQPLSPPSMTARVEATFADRTFHIDAPVLYAWTDPVHGERTRSLLVVPPATLTPLRQAVLFPNSRTTSVALRVRAGRDALVGDVTPGLPAGWKVEPASHPVRLDKAGHETTVRFDVTPPANAAPEDARPAIVVDGQTWSLREDVIDYAHIPVQLVLQPAAWRAVPLAIELPRGVVGYVPGSGDTVAEDLAHAGVRVETIDDDTLRAGALDRFSAIVVGIRAFNTRGVVRAAHPRLMSYVEQGGTLVVQYNTHNRVAPLDGPIGPYPLQLDRDRITDETAVMTPVNPTHPLLLAPNRITDADFDGWVQERGIYFASSWDERYEPLFSAADPDEEPLLGGTLVARHGRGRYVYTGLAFFRQLPAGVPGAYRLFMNLLSGAGGR